ncbi:cell division protein SepF [Helcococcus kunzii]|uniref:Cell division protein SepF n=1 Tax=Helcococcus kunzii ATCC 51366 TaxID=883114 RepID=H3NN80_9FIRM|nr:cell division protein SepF [Helcococcus kunzii]EHR34484.1 hypothetical protein HMPREF9709_00791 [Helcococcus kunzii ATCC 51366]QUY64729.1 cell division protein SepF [Helcococcus kunzii]QZO77138.1 cell division protein SepF [Helcococcus kunzii]
MAFWDKVKDFIGIEDDYIEEDEYGYEDDDYEFSDTEKIDFNENIENDEETTYQTKMEEKPYRSTETRTTQRPSSTETRNVRSYGSNNNMIVSIKEPLTYEDSKSVIDDIQDKKTVVLNLEMLEMDKKTQIFYFVSGGVYALNGSIQNVTKDIYVLVPEGVEVDSKIKDTISEKSLYQI